MTVTLVPLPDGLDGDEADRLGQIINAINGYAGQGIRFNLTSYDRADRFGLQVRNTGGLHFAAYDSGDDPSSAAPIFEITDAGIVSGLPTHIENTLLVDGDLEVLGDALIHGTIAGDAGIDLIGGGDISGNVLFHAQIQSALTTGTAPLQINSQTLVGNLNADLLDGFHASHFATEAEIISLIASLGNYVLKAGDSMTGLLSITPNNDQALELIHTSGQGGFYLGASNAANPVLIFKDNGSTETFEVGNSVSTYQAQVFGALHVTTGSFFDSDLTVGSSTGNILHVLASTSFQGGVKITGGTVDGYNTSGHIQARFGSLIVNDTATHSLSDSLWVNGVSEFNGDFTGVSGVFDWQNGSGGSRIKANSTGIGFFGATPVTKQTIVGSRGGNVALTNLMTALSNLGLVIDSTT